MAASKQRFSGRASAASGRFGLYTDASFEAIQDAEVDATAARRVTEFPETIKGQHRTLGVSDDLDHVIAVARVGGGDSWS